MQEDNAQNCWNDGYEDGKADNPFNKDRASGCSEYDPDYEGGYNSGCIIDSTESSCELIIQGEQGYCPWHPDIAGCVDFLHNDTNKLPGFQDWRTCDSALQLVVLISSYTENMQTSGVVKIVM